MLLKDLIVKLQTLYTEEMKTADIMGEPTIEIDSFELWNKKDGLFIYKGFSHEIDIQRSDDGVYNILNRIVKKGN